MKFLILVDKLLASGNAKYTSSSEIKQVITRTIEAEFPNYSLPDKVLHNGKIAELRQLFRLKEFRTHFTKKSFEQARNKARETHNFPAVNIQKRSAPLDLFVQDVIRQGQWTSLSKVGQLWKQLPKDKISEYQKRSEKVKQQIAEFEQNKLPQLLNDPTQFYWLLRVSFSNYL